MLIGIDKDIDALSAAQEKLKKFTNVNYVHGNHDDIKNILETMNISGVDGILLDLGVSSYQIDEASRGFSYINDADLDMRMDKTQELTAKTVVNSYSKEDLTKILFEYGEEKFAKKIVNKICEYRKNNEIKTTKQLVQIIQESLPEFAKHGDGHPAKRTFQAIRIEVNNEIKPLYNTILECIKCLNKNGRLCVITFHSLEDRAVKLAYTDALGKCTCPKDLPYCVCNKQTLGKIINKKPILPSEEELKQNSRSKSAKLRIFEKI